MIPAAIFYLAFAWWVIANTETEEDDACGESDDTR